MSKQPNQNPFQIFSKLISLFLRSVMYVFGRSALSKSKKLANQKNRQHKQNVSKIKLNKKVARFWRSLVLSITTLIFTITFSGINFFFTSPASAFSGLYIEPITWDFIGLDSNNVAVGPNNFLLAARVCNITSNTVNNITLQYQRTGAFNPFITVTAVNGFNLDTILIPSLPGGTQPLNHHRQSSSGTANITPANCFDGYFNAVVDRNSAAYRTVQQYRIVAASSVGSADTNSALNSGIVDYEYGKSVQQQLFVEKLISQSRNAVVSFVGGTNVSPDPMTGGTQVFVGDIVEYTLTTTTATAYPQLTVSSDFPNGILQLVDVKTTYSSDGGAVSSSVYYDGCGWIADPSNVGYNTSADTCNGIVPNQDKYGGDNDGKVGNTVTTRYRIKVLSTGNGASSNTIQVKHLINDFSGGSFHYNADYGGALGISTITVKDSTTDLQIVKSHTGNFATGDNIYNLAVKNNGSSAARGQLRIVDTLPAGFTYNPSTTTTATGGGLSEPWTCAATGQTVNCTNPNTNTFAVGAISTLNLGVTVDATAATYSLNKATLSSNSPDSNLANNSSSDPTTVLSGANISLAKTHSPATFIVGSTGTYTLDISNSSAFTGIGPIVISDKLPTGISYISGVGSGPNSPIVYPSTTVPSGCTAVTATTVSCPWTVSASGQNVTFQNNANLVPGAPSVVGASSQVTINVAISSTAFNTPFRVVNGVPEVKNTATATTTNFDPVTSNNNADDYAPVQQPIPDLEVRKSHLDAAGLSSDFVKGGLNKYTITVKNVGVAPTSGTITVTETFPAGAVMSYRVGIAGGTVLTNGWSSTTVNDGNTGLITFTNPGPLAAGASSSFDIIVTPNPPTVPFAFGTDSGFDSSASPPTSLSNGNKVVVSTTGDTNPTNNTYFNETKVVAQAAASNDRIDQTIIKTVTTTPTTNDKTVVYTINLSEPIGSAAPRDAVIFTDVIPSEITFNRLNGITCTVLDGTNKSECGTLDNTTPQQTITYTGMLLNKGTAGLRITVTGTLSAGFTGTLSNTGTVKLPTPTSLQDINPANNISTASFTYNGADLSIVKSTPSANVIRNGSANYTITVTNVGSGATTGTITVTDTLDASLTFVSGGSGAGSSGWTCTNALQVVTCTNLGPLAVNQISRINIQTTVSNTATLTPPTVIPNFAIVSTPGTTNKTSNTVNVTPIAANSDLRITKAGPGTTNLGQNLTYTLTVDNVGTTTAIASVNPITVTDTLQSGLTFLSGTGSGWSCSAAGQVVTCTNDTDLAPSATSTITISTLVGTNTTSPINNFSTVALTGETTVGSNNTSNTVVTTINQSADLAIAKSRTGNLIQGQNVTYNLLVTNNGPSSVPNASNITVTDTLPNNLEFLSSTGGGFTCTAPAKSDGAAQVVTCTRTTGLVVGTSATITLNVLVRASTPTGSITNTATVSSLLTDPVPANNTSSETGTVAALDADLKLTKRTLGPFVINSQGTYSLAVENLGPALATGTLTITDNLPANLTLASFIGDGWTCTTIGSASVTCTNPNTTGLAVGSITAVNITVNIGTATPTGTPTFSAGDPCVKTGGGGVINKADLTQPSYESNSNLGNNTSCVPTTINGSADLKVTKTSASTFTVGQQATYTLTIENLASSSSAAANPITLTDQLPNGLTYVSGTGTNWSCPPASPPPGPDVVCTYSQPIAIGANTTSNPLSIVVNVTNTVMSPFMNFASAFSTTPDPNTDNNTARFDSTLATATPNLNIVKRITAINGVALPQTFTANPTETSTSNSIDAKWPSPNTKYLRGAIAQNVKTGDSVEYTVYFLANGTDDLKNVKICDRVPENSDFAFNTFDSPTLGKGILLGWDSTGAALPDPDNSTVSSTKVALTNLADTDKGTFIAKGGTVEGICGDNTNTAGNKTNGSVFIQVVSSSTTPTTIPKATSAGVPANSYGFIRFNAIVK